MAGLHFDITGDDKNLQTTLDRVRKSISTTADEVEQSGLGIEELFGKIKGSIAGLGAAFSAQQLVSQIATVRGEFQQLEVAFTTMLGSEEKAMELMSQITRTAAVTPFGLQDVAGGAKQLLAYGVSADKVNETLVRLGDIAAGLSIPLNDLVYLYGTTMAQGQMFTEDLKQFQGRGIPMAAELAKVFGTTENQVRKLVSEGKVGFAEMEKAIVSMTSEGGKFGGLMEAQSKTIIGQISNIEDAIDGIFNELGQETEGVINNSLSGVTVLLDNYEKIGKTLLELTVAYGIYKAAIIAVSAIEKLRYQSALIHMANLTKMQALMSVVNAKAAALNKTLMANPWAIAAAAVVALGYGMYKLITYQTDAQKMQEKLNESFKDFSVEAAKEERSLNSIFDALKNTAQGTSERSALIKSINEQYGEYLPHLLTEKSNLDEINAAYEAINDTLKQQIAIKAKNAAVDKVLSDGLEQQVEAVDNIRKALTEKLGNVGLVDTIISEIKQTTTEFQKAGMTWEKAWQQAYFNVQRKYTGKAKLGNDFAVSMEDYVRSFFDTEKAISMIDRQYAPFIDKVKTLSSEASTEQENAVVSDLNKEDKDDLNKREKIQDELLDLMRKNQQEQIDLMQEGSQKKSAQINLDYDNEIAAIMQKEKEWREAQGGKLTEDQSKALNRAYVNAEIKRVTSEDVVEKEQREAETKAMNDYLVKYGEYHEKRAAIKKKYDDLIAQATTKGDKMTLKQEMQETLDALDEESLNTTTIITKLFDDMSDKTTKDLRAIADEGRQFLRFVKEGQFSEDNEFGITKEQFELLQKTPDVLKDIENGVQDVSDQADQMETSFGKVSNGLKKVFSKNVDVKALGEGLGEVEDGLGGIMGAANFLIGTFRKLGDAFGGGFEKVAEGMEVAMDAVNSTLEGAKAGSVFGPIGAAAGAAIGLVSSLAASIAKIHDAKNERRIQRLQDQIEDLEKEYEKLDKAIENAYSNNASSLYEKQNALLKQQAQLIQQQIKEEEDKKKTDRERIKEWQNELDNINQIIEDNKEAAKEAIFGQDLQSAIDDFANAYVEMWQSGNDKAKSSKEIVKNMIKSMINESIKAAASDPMRTIREKLLEFWSDEYISGWEQDYLNKMVSDLQNKLDSQFGWADDIYKNNESYKQEATKGSFGTEMTHEDAGELSGRFTALQITGEEIKMQVIQSVMYLVQITTMTSQNTGLLNDILFQHVISNSYLEDITRYSKIMSTYGEKLDKIAENIKNI